MIYPTMEMYEALHAEKAALYAEIDRLRAAPPGTVSVELFNTERSVGDSLRAENDRLRAEIEQLEAENKWLYTQMAAQKATRGAALAGKEG